MPLGVAALGANLGDRRLVLDRALRELERLGFRIEAKSRLYRTRPWLPGLDAPPQPGYLNAAVAFRAAMSPREALEACLEAERRLGRDRPGRWAARTLDIDLIFFGGARVERPDLTLPHPRWSERDFVVAPLLDLGTIPPGETAAGARRRLMDLLAAAPPNIESAAEWR